MKSCNLWADNWPYRLAALGWQENVNWHFINRYVSSLQTYRSSLTWRMFRRRSLRHRLLLHPGTSIPRHIDLSLLVTLSLFRPGDLASFPGLARLSLAVQNSHWISDCKWRMRKAWEWGYRRPPSARYVVVSPAPIFQHFHTLSTLAHSLNTFTLSQHFHTLSTLAHSLNTCTLSQHLHTLSTLAHSLNTCTLSQHFHTLSTLAHSLNTCTLSQHFHTLSTLAHSLNTCTLSQHFHTLSTLAHSLNTCTLSQHFHNLKWSLSF